MFEVLFVTHQCRDSLQGRLSIMLSVEDSQIDFAEGKVLLNVSFRPLPPHACMLHSKTEARLELYLLFVPVDTLYSSTEVVV